MKLVVALGLVGLCAFAVSSPTGDDTYPGQYKTVATDKTFADKQRKILSLFRRINQPSYNEEHVQIVKSFKLQDTSLYTKPEVAERITEFYQNGYQLPKKEIFSLSYPEHLEQAIAVFDLFYYAKDFDTFYKTAVVARHWLNEAMFLYSYSVAIIHRPDCYGIVIPPLYEIYPYYFFNSETIQQAYKYKQTWNGQPIQSTGGKYPGYTIVSNYSGYYINLHPEQSLSYYLEDVEYNNFYYTYYLYYPWWMDGEKYGINNDKRGELFLFLYQQILSRYYLERLSNDFGQIPLLDLDVPIETPYYPSLQYPNGLQFPERPKFARLSDYFYSYAQHVRSHFAHSLSYYKDYSRRIVDAIDRGYCLNRQGERVELYNDKHGYNIIGNLLQSNPDSPDQRFYGPWLSYGRHALGYSYTPLYKDKVAPSALEHIETCLRDPVFYQLYKILMNYNHRYQSYLPPYTRKELTWNGVQIEKVEIDRLITYFDEFYSDLSQAVYYSDEELKSDKNNFFVRAKQYRLNHKPFTYKLHVQSASDAKAVVKVFIGPKYDEYGRYINISENRWNFFELDKFVYDLKSGENVIKKSSYESTLFSTERTSFYDLYKQAISASEGQGEFIVDPGQNYFNFPYRYMLPKGSTGGYPFQFYFIVYPYKPYTGNKPQEWTYHYPRPGVGGPYIDDYPLYYPFDREIKYGKTFYEDIPNSFFYETRIYHKKDVNAVTPEH